MKNHLVSFSILLIMICSACQDKKQKQLVENLVVEQVPIALPKQKIDTSITKDFVLGKFDYKTHQNFIKVNEQHASIPLYLNITCYDAFIKMYEAAKADGIYLKIISGTRNFYEQKRIWERKWAKYANLEPKTRALKILEYSSMPTSSRHHWGTDMDLNNLNNTYFEKGTGLKLYNWLLEHAKTYGFNQVYTSKINGRTGYNMEKWHWSYMPLSEKYLTFYNENISYKDITGFKGSEQAKTIDVIKNYVNGIYFW